MPRGELFPRRLYLTPDGAVMCGEHLAGAAQGAAGPRSQLVTAELELDLLEAGAAPSCEACGKARLARLLELERPAERRGR